MDYISSLAIEVLEVVRFLLNSCAPLPRTSRIMFSFSELDLSASSMMASVTYIITHQQKCALEKQNYRQTSLSFSKK